MGHGRKGKAEGRRQRAEGKKKADFSDLRWSFKIGFLSLLPLVFPSHPSALLSH
jgi:hypothetical protein